MRMAPKFPCIGVLGLLGFLASCSDPVPPASRGSASIHFQGPSMAAAAAGKQCPPGVHNADAPSTQLSEQRTTGNSRPADIIIDGEKSRTFGCSVVPSGDKFVVDGHMIVPAFDKDNKQLTVPTQIRVHTTIGKDETGAKGTLSVGDDATAPQVFYQSDACAFSVKAGTNNTKLAVDAGKIWGSVTCDSISDLQNPTSSCQVDVGYFILENCDQ